MKKSKILLLAAIVCVAAVSARSQSSVGPGPEVERLRAEIHDLMKNGDVPGLSIAVVENGDRVWRELTESVMPKKAEKSPIRRYSRRRH